MGALFRWERRSSVRPPSPILVKKLIANLQSRSISAVLALNIKVNVGLYPRARPVPGCYLVSLGLSLGRSPSQASAMVGSLVLSHSLPRPRNSASSWNRILMKIREL